MNILRFVVRFIDRLSEGIAKCAMWLILLFVIVTIIDVVLRYFFQAPTIWAREFVALLFGPLWLLTGAYLLSIDEHVRMDLLFHHFSIRKKAIVDLITFTLFFLYFAIIGYYAWQDWWSTLTMGEHSRSVWRPVLWPFKLGIPVGISLLFLAGIAKYIRDLYVAVTGRSWNGH
jgi:TRAP-type mannitol/chloroaromatic compound transport system permease small subunit